MKRYCIKTSARDVGGLPVEFPFHEEDPRGAWVRFEDAERFRVENEAMRAVVEAARAFAMDNVDTIPRLFNALRAAVLSLPKEAP